MKIKLLLPHFFLLTLGLLSGCNQTFYKTTTFPSGNVLENYPVPPPHGHEVKIIFPGEDLKDTSYIKITVLEVSGPNGTSYNELVNLIKKKAQAYGVDAILILDKEQNLHSSYHPSSSYRAGNHTYNHSGYTSFYQYPSLSGLGLVYKKNLDYVNHYLKSVTLYKIPITDSTKRIFDTHVLLDFDANEKKIDSSTVKFPVDFYLYTSKYEPFFLLGQTKDWRYTKDELGRINKRWKGTIDSPVKECDLTFEENKVKEILLISYSGLVAISKETILISYDSKNRISQTTITANKKITYKELFYYDNLERVIKSKFFRIDQGNVIPFLETDYEYYSQEDFKSK